MEELSALPHTVLEREDGYDILYSNGSKASSAAMAWAKLERLCCPFLDISIEEHGNETMIRITGAEGAKKIIDLELPGLVRSTA